MTSYRMCYKKQPSVKVMSEFSVVPKSTIVSNDELHIHARRFCTLSLMLINASVHLFQAMRASECHRADATATVPASLLDCAALSSLDCAALLSVLKPFLSALSGFSGFSALSEFSEAAPTKL